MVGLRSPRFLLKVLPEYGAAARRRVQNATAALDLLSLAPVIGQQANVQAAFTKVSAGSLGRETISQCATNDRFCSLDFRPWSNSEYGHFHVFQLALFLARHLKSFICCSAKVR
jgi:hypothetical protein